MNKKHSQVFLCRMIKKVNNLLKIEGIEGIELMKAERKKALFLLNGN